MIALSKSILRSAVVFSAVTGLLSAQEAPDRAFLGVHTEPLSKDGDGARRFGLKVTYVYPHSSAERIGIRIGDVIVAMNDFLLPDTETLVKQLRREKVGATVRFVVEREGKRLLLKGKIGGYRKTMAELEKDLRKRLYGKPPPKLEPIRWWNPETRDFYETDGDLASRVQGKITVITIFDDCSQCVANRYRKFVQVKDIFSRLQDAPPLAFIGLYQSDVQEREGGLALLLERARKLFRTYPPNYAVGVLHHPEGIPSGKEREEKLYVHNHGTLILDARGAIRYLQILGLPEREFLKSLTKLIEEEKSTKQGSAGKKGGAEDRP